MDAMTNDFGDVLLWSFWFFIWIAALMVWFRCLFDLFGDHTLSGGAKAGWAVLLIFVPWLGALIYLIARGRSMTERQVAKAAEQQAAQADYIKQVAGRAGLVSRPDRERQGAPRHRRDRPERVRHPEGQGTRLRTHRPAGDTARSVTWLGVECGRIHPHRVRTARSGRSTVGDPISKELLSWQTRPTPPASR